MFGKKGLIVAGNTLKITIPANLGRWSVKRYQIAFGNLQVTNIYEMLGVQRSNLNDYKGMVSLVVLVHR